MKTNDICEALYALPGGVVEARRRPVVKPLAIALAGAALLVVDTVAIDSDSGNLDAAMLLIGSTMLLWGLIEATTRLFGQDRVPYYRPDGVYLRRRERYYRHEQLTELRRAVIEGDQKAIDALPETNVSAVTLVEYVSPRSAMRARRVYAYAEFDRRPIGDTVITGVAAKR